MSVFERWRSEPDDPPFSAVVGVLVGVAVGVPLWLLIVLTLRRLFG
jgi:hypothetical protein